MGKRGFKSKAEKTANLEMKEAELNKIEELNRREKKALDERAELLRRKEGLDSLEDRGDASQDPEVETIALDPGFVDAMQALSSEGQIYVYKEMPTGLEKVAQFPVLDAETMDVQIDNVAREHGGGAFLVRLMGEKGRIARSKRFVFNTKAYSKPAAPAGTDQSFLLQMMVESRKEMTELLKTMVMANASRPQTPAGLGSVQDIAAIAGLFNKGGSPTDTKGMMELFSTALKWGKDLANGQTPVESGGENNILRDLVQPFLAVLAQIQAKHPAPQAPARPSVPATGVKPLPPVPVDGNIPAVPAEEASVDPSVQNIRSNFFYRLYVPQIIKAAKENVDPADVADDILRTVPSTHHGMIRKFVESPDVVEYIATFEPVAREHAEWVKSVAGSLIEFMDEDEKEESVETVAVAPANGHSTQPLPREAVLPAGPPPAV